MQITYWTDFYKRINSTKVPSTAGTTLDVKLKDVCNFDSPTFILTGVNTSINYIKAFDHYYFVDNIDILNNYYTEISCTMDVLATFRSSISGYSGFIERSTNKFNDMIPDPNVTIEQGETIQSMTYSAPTLFNAVGVYVLGVSNTLASAGGFVSYYLMDQLTVQKIANYVNQTWGSGAQTVLEFLQQTILHTGDSIISCIWLPLSLATVQSALGSSEQIKIGSDNITYGGSPVVGYRLTNNEPVVNWTNLSGTALGLQHVYSDFRCASPYSENRLYIPFVGDIELNMLDFPHFGAYLNFDIDCTTGQALIQLYNNDKNYIASYSTMIGVDCPVSKSSVNLMGAGASLLSTGVNIATAIASQGGTAVASGISAAVSASNALVSGIQTQTGVHGSNSGRSYIKDGLKFRSLCIAKNTTSPSALAATIGRPYMEIDTIGNLSGYVKCYNASVNINGDTQEKDKVNAYLNSGFFFE